MAVATAKVDAQSTLGGGIERGWDVHLIIVIGDGMFGFASNSLIEKRLARERAIQKEWVNREVSVNSAR